MSLLLLFGGSAGPTDVTVELPLLDDAEVFGPLQVASSLIELPLLDGGEVFGPGALVPGNVNVALPAGDGGEVFAVQNIYEPKAIAVGFIDGGVVFGPRGFGRTDADGNVIVPTELVAWLLDTDASVLGELTLSWGRQFQDVHNDTGTGQANLQNGDPLLGSATYGRLVRFDVDGVAAFAMLIEGRAKVATHQDEEVALATALTGRGHAAEWEHAAVDPPLGLDQQPWHDQRIFGWQDPTLDTSSWATAVETTTNVGQIGVDPGDLALYPPTPPQGFPTRDAIAIWSLNSAGPSVPAGYNYFDRVFTTVAAKRVVLAAAADDAYDACLNGVPQLTDPGYFRGNFKTTPEFDLPAGTHTVRVRAENQNAAKGMLWLAIMEVDTTTGALLPTPVLVTDSSWKVLGYPATVPGFTAGGLILQVLAEAQAQGQLLDWTCSFTELVDTAGNPWPDVVELAADVGLDLLSLLRQLAETYIDWAASPGAKELNAWAIGTRGNTATGVTLAEGVNLLELTHQGDGTMVNDLTIRYDGGYTRVQDSASIAANGRRRGKLRLEGQLREDEAQRIGAELLAVNAAPRSASVATVEPAATSDRPYSGDWQVADWLTSDDEDGTPELVRVRSLSIIEDDNGVVGRVAELRDQMLERDELLRRTMKRAVLGMLGGRTDSASFTSARPPEAATYNLEVIPPFNFTGDVFVDESGTYTFQTYERIVAVVATGTCTGSSVTTELAWYRNGVQFGTDLQLFATGDGDYIRNDDSTLDEQFAPGDRLTVAVVAAGDHEQVVVQFIGAR